MAAETKISWCDSTFNPWVGCTKISPACDNCYAAVHHATRALGVEWGAGNSRRRTSESNWKLPLRWNRMDGIKLSAWDKFKSKYPCVTDYELQERGFIKPRRRRVFTGSMCDVFDNEVPTEWRSDFFSLIRETPNLDWLILTKRIGTWHACLESVAGDSGVSGETGEVGMSDTWAFAFDWLHGTQPHNVWLGATICNQAEADRDIPKLLSIPAAVRFISIEPMLGPIDLTRVNFPTGRVENVLDCSVSECLKSIGIDSLIGIDWVYVQKTTPRNAVESGSRAARGRLDTTPGYYLAQTKSDA